MPPVSGGRPGYVLAPAFGELLPTQCTSDNEDALRASCARGMSQNGRFSGFSDPFGASSQLHDRSRPGPHLCMTAVSTWLGGIVTRLRFVRFVFLGATNFGDPSTPWHHNARPCGRVDFRVPMLFGRRSVARRCAASRSVRSVARVAGMRGDARGCAGMRGDARGCTAMRGDTRRCAACRRACRVVARR